MKKGRNCCQDVKEVLMDLYVNVKVRNDQSIDDITSDKVKSEKDSLKKKDHLELISMIKESIEFLISLKIDEEESYSRLMKKGGESGVGFTSVGEYSRILEDVESVKGENSHKQYEEMLVKLEGDIRQHIRIE